MKKKKIIRNLALILGICLCAYPLVASIIEQQNQSRAVSTYENEVKDCDDKTLEQMIKDAEEYNDKLYQSKSSIVSTLREGILSSENYNKLLNVSGSGVMGTIEIPKINVNLPIYHGTGEDVLSVGVGHLEGSSLPVGGFNTHCVLTGHRGLPNSKLFTRLDELEKGDLFYIRTGDRIADYLVSEIQVIRPEDVGGLSVQTEKDMVSLITCTPYGVNSHRLVVTGERTEYEKMEHLSIEPQMASMRELLFAILPFVMIGAVAIKLNKERRERNRAK